MKDLLLSQCSKLPSDFWHEYFHVFIQSLFERVAAALGQFGDTNYFLHVLEVLMMAQNTKNISKRNLKIHYYQWSFSCFGSMYHLIGEIGKAGLVAWLKVVDKNH